MKNILALMILAGITGAETLVAICKFKNGSLSAYADDPMLCSGDYEQKVSIVELYKIGWKYKGSYNAKDGEPYLVFEKEATK